MQAMVYIAHSKIKVQQVVSCVNHKQNKTYMYMYNQFLTCTPVWPLAVQLRQEVEGVTARLRFISEAQQTVRDDIALTRRATEKTVTDVTKAEEDKLQQVYMYIYTCIRNSL